MSHLLVFKFPMHFRLRLFCYKYRQIVVFYFSYIILIDLLKCGKVWLEYVSRYLLVVNISCSNCKTKAFPLRCVGIGNFQVAFLYAKHTTFFKFIITGRWFFKEVWYKLQGNLFEITKVFRLFLTKGRAV